MLQRTCTFRCQSQASSFGSKRFSSAPYAGRHRLVPTCAAFSADSSPVFGSFQPQQTPADELHRRQMLALGCACCFNILTSTSAAGADEGSPFTYGEEAGPLNWGGLCRTGTQQSPINLPRQPAAADATCGDTTRPTFRYQENNNVHIKNTGTTIQVSFEPGNVLDWRGQQLELLQYHFHTPSEHAWDGQRTAMEAHLVHRNKATGGFAVVGVMMQPSTTHAQQQPNPCLAAALQFVPEEPQTEAVCPFPVNPLQLLPTEAAEKQFVHYSGSLTTPPCSESVDWLVWEQPVPVTDQQVLDFMSFVGSRKTYGHNSRPLQPINGRSLQYDCLSVK